MTGLGANAQKNDVFGLAEKQCPMLPKGLLEAVAFTNTQCHHLTDADYKMPADDPTAMPRAYGMMGLVRDGKGCFRDIAAKPTFKCPKKCIANYKTWFVKNGKAPKS